MAGKGSLKKHSSWRISLFVYSEELFLFTICLCRLLPFFFGYHFNGHRVCNNEKKKKTTTTSHPISVIKASDTTQTKISPRSPP